ncbi:post-GPI attachment to proteins factor 4 [Bufo gargarizans]|uniref:post-GPI attachment to proteins factor 4 n=1 Tax=Bufo gargarizans TaxID=30331 RepID=UPI001CF5282C|nr:post-GPI attachment to proteins factor 4 [Bufo gargarizans]
MCFSAVIRTPCFHLLALFIITLFLATFCFHGLLYSPLFSRRLHLQQLSRDFLQQNLKDGTNDLKHFQQLVSPGPYNISLPCNHRPLESLKATHAGTSTPLIITIITTRRRPEYHYLLQVAHGFLDRLNECGTDCSDFKLLVCNVDPVPNAHTDACLLSHFLPSVARYLDEHIAEAPNRFEQEKQDYAYCLACSLELYTPEYVLLVEDDAVPLKDIFSAFFHLVQVRFPTEPLGGGLYTKLYHPERLQGYVNPEPMRILEWIGLGGVSGLALTWLYTIIFYRPRFSWPMFVVLTIYVMLLAELTGRHYLLELRRVSPALYNVVPVTECCTPAMLFSETSARRTLQYLEEFQCAPGYAKDIALYKELRKRKEWAWALEPNLVKHVGMFSSLRGWYEGEEPMLL